MEGLIVICDATQTKGTRTTLNCMKTSFSMLLPIIPSLLTHGIPVIFTTCNLTFWALAWSIVLVSILMSIIPKHVQQGKIHDYRISSTSYVHNVHNITTLNLIEHAPTH